MGIGSIIGGALQGFGKGTAEVGRMAADERRQTALEELRAKNSKASQTRQYDLADRNATRSDARSDLYGARNAERKAVASEASDKRDLDKALTLTKIQQNHQESMARLNAELDLKASEQKAARQAQQDAQDAGTYVKKFITNENGELVGMTATGKEIKTGVRPQPKPENSSSSYGSVAAARGERSGGLGGPSPVRTPQPAATPKATAPTAPKAGEVIDGYRFKGGDPANSNNWSKAT